MEIYQGALLILAGIAAGFINTVAGGGSLLTLPLLIFMGLPPAMANGTNRVALVIQNMSAIAGFKSKGISSFKYASILGATAFVGAIVGAKISVELSGELFNRILSVVIVLVVASVIFNPMKNAGQQIERLTTKHQVIGAITFFFVGIYGGFIQAGVGFIIMAALTFVNRFSLVKTNSIKVFVVLIYTFAALGVFIYSGMVNWLFGLTLAVGNGTGAWIASRMSVDKGDKFVKGFLIFAALGMAVMLWVRT